MRRILHAHRDGKYSALDNRDAVVVDYDAQMIRISLDQWPVNRPTVWRFMVFMLRSADLLQHYEAIAEAIAVPTCGRVYISQVARAAETIFAPIGMTLETVDQVGLRLHTDPRSTLACCKTLAPGQPLPSRVRSMRSGRGAQHMTPAPLVRSSTPGMRRRSKESTP